MIDERAVFKEVCEYSFAFFCKQFLKVVEPETDFVWNWHLDAICETVEKSYTGDYPKLDINVPPRTLKSMIINILFPCWVWAKDPSKKFLCASSGYDLAVGFNIKRRDLVTSDLYSELWDIELREDLNKVNFFANSSGGFMQAVSALGKVTGKGGDFLLSDDLLDAKDSFSKTKRDEVRRWYTTAFYNRAQNKKDVVRININQRLHQQDISDMLAGLDFKALILPMVKEDIDRSTVDFKDPREVGELLFPERYGESEMQDDIRALGQFGWSSQYQQRPMPIGGGIIKEEWPRFYSGEAPKGGKTIIVADLSFKGNDTSDYNSIACWRAIDSKRYLIDMIRGKWSYTKTKEMFSQFCEKNKEASLKFVEDKANGSALIDDLRDEITGLRAWPGKGSKYAHADKVERLYFVQPDFELGNVYLPEDVGLIDAYLQELIGFTDSGSTTGNDDMVDTTTMALLELKKTKTFFAG